MTGPKISSLAMAMLSWASAKTVGSRKNPFSPIRLPAGAGTEDQSEVASYASLAAAAATQVCAIASSCAVSDVDNGRKNRSTERVMRAPFPGSATSCPSRKPFRHLTPRQQPCALRLAQLDVVEGPLEPSQVHLRPLLSCLVKRVSHGPAHNRSQFDPRHAGHSHQQDLQAEPLYAWQCR